MAIEQVNDNVLIYELFLPHNSASDVPDVAAPVETVDKGPANSYLFILSSFMYPD